MNVTRHFSDTRTDTGRVRFLVHAGRVALIAEGEGWQHHSTHPSLNAAALFLATLSRVSGPLYERALRDLERAQRFEQAFAA
ncbi:hypothetical protein [Deinococcus hohokamensis]|uniref:Uncharacterized protein n=1 Tax=Deinococcus hohokamensis TaxID=309883 RepID=A0ABV9I7X9_9DEIO